MGGRARIRVATGLVAGIVGSGTGAVGAMDADGRGVSEAQTTATTAVAANPDEIPVPAVPERASRDGARQAGAAREATVVADHWPVPGPPTVRSDFYDVRWSARDKRWVLHGGLDVAVDERRWTQGAPVEAIGGGGSRRSPPSGAARR